MSVWTCRFLGVFVCQVTRSVLGHMVPPRHWLQVGWIHTLSVLALMVQFRVRRNWSLQQFISNNVCVTASSLEEKAALSSFRMDAGQEIPAIRRRVFTYLRHQARQRVCRYDEGHC